MLKLADIAVYSPDNRLQLTVEVKSKTKAHPDWVAAMRRNLFAHSAVPISPFFLLAMPDRFCLWKNAYSSVDAVPPDYEIDSAPILAPYLNNTAYSLENLSEYSFELIIASWLNDLVNSNLTRETEPPYLTWLFDSGLYDAIKNGSVKTEASL